MMQRECPKSKNSEALSGPSRHTLNKGEKKSPEMSISSEKRLLEAARRCDGEAIEVIAKAGRTNLDAIDQNGSTAVHFCTKSADLTSLAVLLENGAKTDVHDKSGMVALHHAAIKDYVETMALLLSYGANVNQQNKNNGMTALHYATSSNHRRAADFLLFCGADYSLKDQEGQEAFKQGLSDAMRMELRFVHEGYKTGQIQFSGKMLRPSCQIQFTSLDLTISNNDSNNRSTCFFCRRVTLDYVRSNVKDGSEVISDVFQYLVSQPSDCVTITLPGYSHDEHFDEVVVKDHIRNVYKCSRCLKQDGDSQTVYYSTTIQLFSDNEGQGHFMVVAVGKEEQFIATGKQQILQSSVEEGFELEIPEKCLVAGTKVVLKVLPTQDRTSILSAHGIHSASNFYEVDLSSRQLRRLRLSLPLLNNLSPGSEVIVCHAEENQISDNAWSTVSYQREDRAGQITVTEPTIGRGTAIVLGVPKTPKKKEYDLIHKIKQFLSWLYDTVARRLKPCVFSALTKSSDGQNFRVLVILGEEKKLEKLITKFREENFQTQLTQTSGILMVKPSDNFILKLEGTNLQIKGNSLFRISAQSKRISQHEFLVMSKQFDFIQLLVFKLKAEQNVDMKMLKSEKCLVQINIELRMESATVKDVQPSFTEFPDSVFLCELAAQVGEEWFLLGVSLGLGPSFLETVQRQNDPVRTNQTLLYTWRAENDGVPDLGVIKLINALGVTGRNDLVMLLNRRISKLMVEKPGERISKWAKQLLAGLDDVDSGATDSDTVTNFDSLIDTETDPSSDQFLVKVSQIIGPQTDILPQLGIGNKALTAMLQTMSPSTAMLKCLIQCRRKHADDAIKFLDELLEALTVTKNNLAATEIMKLFNKWLKSSATDRKSKSSMTAFCEKFQHL